MDDKIDIIDELKDAFRTRLKSPFLVAYSASFTAWNWRLFTILLVGKTPAVARIASIDEMYRASWNYSWLVTNSPVTLAQTNLVIFPVLSAVIFVVIAPWAEYAAQRYLEMVDEHRKTSQNNYLKRIDTLAFARESARHEHKANLAAREFDRQNLVASHTKAEADKVLHQLRIAMGYLDRLGRRDAYFIGNWALQKLRNEADPRRLLQDLKERGSLPQNELTNVRTAYTSYAEQTPTPARTETIQEAAFDFVISELESMVSDNEKT